MDLWFEIRQLQGKRLKTLLQSHPFTILDVRPGKVTIRVETTGNERPIDRNEIEGAWRELEQRGRLSRGDIQEQYSPRNPAYVAAMLAALPGVTYRARPVITLFYDKRSR